MDSARQATDLRDERRNATNKADISGYTVGYVHDKQAHEGNSNKNESNGSDQEELYGLSLEERKRQRTKTQVNVAQTKQKDISVKDSTLSHEDCVETSSIFLAKLARQAGQEP